MEFTLSESKAGGDIRLPYPTLGRLSGGRILGAALAISLALHALALLLDPGEPPAGGAAPLRATLLNPTAAAPAAPAIAPPPLDDAIAAPKREAAFPEPVERTYPRPSAAAPGTDPVSESVVAGESAGTPAPAYAAAAPAAESALLPPLPRPAIDPTGLSQYHAALNRATARFRIYPAQARDAGWEGQVALRLSISEAGLPVGLELIGSSGYPILDRAALEMMHLAATHTPVPESLRGRAFTIDLGATYNLKDGF